MEWAALTARCGSATLLGPMRSLLLAVLVLLVAAASPAWAGVETLSFTSASSFVAAPGVTSINVNAVAGAGGTSANGAAGGLGDMISGTVTFAAGSTVKVDIGNGGAAGAGGGLPAGAGGAGGGLAGVEIGTTPKIVAAGGGGGGGYTSFGAQRPIVAPAPAVRRASPAQSAKDLDSGTPTASCWLPGDGDGRRAWRCKRLNRRRRKVPTERRWPVAPGARHGTLGGPPSGGGGGGGAGYWGGGGGMGGGIDGNSGAGGGGGYSYTAPTGVTAITKVAAPAGSTAAVTITYSGAPTVSLDAPAGTNPTSLTGGGSTGAGDAANVVLSFYRGTTATGSPALTTTTKVATTPNLSNAGQYATPVPRLDDGMWTVVVTQTDNLGQTGTSVARTFRVDAGAPAVSLDPAAVNPATMTGSAGTAAGDAATVQVSFYSGTSTTGTPAATASAPVAAGRFSATVPQLQDGTWTAVATQIDDSGHTGTSAPQTFRVDTIAPVVSIDTGAASNPPTLSGPAGTSAGDATSVQVSFYSGAAATGSPALTTSAQISSGRFSAAVPYLQDGTWTVVVTQTDDAGHTGASAPRTFTVDHTAPAPSLSVARYVNTARPQFTGSAGTATSDGSNITLTIMPGVGTQTAPATAGAFSLGWTGTPLADGTYTAYVEQQDASGNTGRSATVTFTVDTAAPAITLAAPPAYTGASVTLSGTGGTAIADDSTVRLDVTDGATVVRSVTAPVSAGAYSGAVTNLADGAYTVTATQRDAAGNTTTTAARNFRVDTTPPSIDTSAVRPSYALGETAAATFSCSDGGGSGVATCNGPSTIDTSAAGDHDLSISATDAAGNHSSALVHYAVLAPAATPQPAVTPVVVAATPAPTRPVATTNPPLPTKRATLALSTSSASRRGTTITLKLRGKADGTGPIKITVSGVSGSGRSLTVKPTKTAWTATLRIHVSGSAPKKIKLTIADSSHKAATVNRTISIRVEKPATPPPPGVSGGGEG